MKDTVHCEICGEPIAFLENGKFIAVGNWGMSDNEQELCSVCLNREIESEKVSVESKQPRFRLEKRSGIIAIYDTKHPKYQDTPGCHADYPWVVAWWRGQFNGSHWEVDKRWEDQAERACTLLNGMPPHSPSFSYGV